jgi:hypothetical protein
MMTYKNPQNLSATSPNDLVATAFGDDELIRRGFFPYFREKGLLSFPNKFDFLGSGLGLIFFIKHEISNFNYS